MSPFQNKKEPNILSPKQNIKFLNQKHRIIKQTKLELRRSVGNWMIYFFMLPKENTCIDPENG